MIVNADNAAAADGRGSIGWYYPDEWDAFCRTRSRGQDLANSIAPPQAGRISFLTLTNHFYSLADSASPGETHVPDADVDPDVVGFDLYPLQVWWPPRIR